MQHAWPIRMTAAVWCLTWIFNAPCAQGAEPVRQFLDGLRDRKLFDDALEYLDSLKSSRLVGDEVKQTILYEQGAMLIQHAGAISDSARIEKLLDEASIKLKEFSAAHADHDLAISANSLLANVSVERGKAKVAAAHVQPDKKQPLMTEARALFAEAQKQFTAAEADLKARLAKIPRLLPPEERELIARRDRIAGDLAQAQFNHASVDYENSKTYDPASDAARAALKSAAVKYGEIAERYRTRMAGLTAHYWEGRCYQEMGDMKQALGCFQDLIDLPPESSEVRALRTKSLRQAMECWTDPHEKKYAEAKDRGELWLKDAGPAAGGDQDGLAVRYFTAVAYNKQAKELPQRDGNRKKMLLVARQTIAPVAQFAGEYQKPAKTLLVELGGKEKDQDAENKEPANYAEAAERGKVAIEGRQSSEMNVRILLENKENGADQKEVEKYQQEKLDQTAAAIKYFKLALALLPKTPAKDMPAPKDVNSIRYYLCYLLWDGGDYYEAAVLGDFLGRHYPDSAEGRQCARIAMAAWAKIYSDCKQADKDFEIAHLVSSAEYVAKHWPGEQEAEEAALTLLSFAIQQRRLDKAMEYLSAIPVTSPRRAQSELKAGQAFWGAYLKGTVAAEGERPPQSELDQLKKQAEQVLSEGVKRMQEAGEANATMAYAMLSLAQVYVDTGQAAKAIATLKQEKFGPINLIKAKDPASENPAFKIETYKAALRAYVALQQTDRAEAIMKALEKLVGKSGDAKAGEALTAIYIGLGKELQRQLQELIKEKNHKELENVSKGFELFLTHIGERKEGNNYSSLAWVAETFYSLANGFDAPGGKPPQRASDYYQKAVKAYQGLLSAAAKDPKFAPNVESLVGVRLRLAVCLRRLGNYDEAIKLIASVLEERPNMLTAQLQAAETYQARGAVDQDSYYLAIHGAQPGKDGQNTIWGWGKLAKKTSDNPKFESTFFEARRRLAESRYLFGRMVKDTAKRRKVIEAAKQDIWFTYKLHPSMGGGDSMKEYEQILKRIQKDLGDKVTGLQEFRDRDAANKRADPNSGASPMAKG